jgi:hypothetical protein
MQLALHACTWVGDVAGQRDVHGLDDDGTPNELGRKLDELADALGMNE